MVSISGRGNEMQRKINTTFVQHHECKMAKKNNIVIEQYREIDDTFTWYHVKDSFFDAVPIKKCPYCDMMLPTTIYSYSEIEEISLLISSKQIKAEYDLNKTEIVQDIIDNLNILAYADIAGEYVQVRWDDKVSELELTEVYEALKEKYCKIRVGVYFKKPVQKKIGFFNANVDFLDIELKEYLLSVKSKKIIEKIS